MAQLGTTFDANTVAPQTPFETIPPGKYTVQITQSEMKATKSGDGQYLWLELEILDGEYHGRKLFDRLNIVNPNPQAVEIAQRALSAICHATGQLSVSDSEQLHFKPMIATVRVRPGRTENGNTFDASNEIRGYGPVNGAAPTQMQRPAAAPAAANKPAAATPPWRKPKAA